MNRNNLGTRVNRTIIYQYLTMKHTFFRKQVYLKLKVNENIV